jgi:hypothetical protein
MLDLMIFPVEGGFRGFQKVPPGYHRITVAAVGDSIQADVLLADDDAVAVLILADDDTLVPDTENADEYSDLARTGAMNRTLIDAQATHPDAVVAWQTATSALDRPLAAIPLDPPVPASADSNRFARFWAAHGEDADAALREVQAAFVGMAINHDDTAQERFAALLQAHYNAGEERISAAAAYFVRFAATLTALASSLAPKLFAADSPGGERLDYLITDLRDAGAATNNPTLQQAADALAAATANA